MNISLSIISLSVLVEYYGRKFVNKCEVDTPEFRERKRALQLISLKKYNMPWA
jgi:hypothetical protein